MTELEPLGYLTAQLGRAVYDDVLARHGFRDMGSFQINPTHAVTYGRAYPASSQVVGGAPMDRAAGGVRVYLPLARGGEYP